MDRRTFNKLASFAAFAALTDNAEMSPAQAAGAIGEIVLQDSELMVAFDPISGALTRMQRKPTKWTIERRPALGVSFRLHTPLPQQRSNFVLGTKQRAASVEKISDNEVRLQWKDMVSEHWRLTDHLYGDRHPEGWHSHLRRQARQPVLPAGGKH